MPTAPDSPAPRRLPRPLALWLGMLGLLAAAAVSLAAGPAPVSWLDWLTGDADPLARTVLLDLRLPRVLLAALVGAVLGVSGAAIQGLFRNPLAEPGLIGVSAGAALAAVLVIVLFPNLPRAVAVPIAAVLGAVLAVWAVLAVARHAGQGQVATALLAGIAINATAGAGIGILTTVADDAALRGLTFWLFGSLSRADWPLVAMAAPALLLPILLLPRDATGLNALLLGEPAAGHLGIAVRALKRRIVVLVMLGVGVAVAFTGIIGFVGLIVPHIARSLLGPDHRVVIPASALCGAVLLMLADALARSLAGPAELPIGVVTAVLGGPFFLWLLWQGRGQ